MKLFCLVACAVFLAGMAWAQIPDDVYFVSYYSGANANNGQDAVVRIDNPGVANGATICADIYVFDADEEMLDCCGCTVSPDDLRLLSVNRNLTAHAANGTKPTTGVIKIVSAQPNPNGSVTCDPTGGATIHGGFKDNIVPTPDIRAWGTHLQSPFTDKGQSNVVTTEEEFQDSTLVQDELNGLQNTCFGIYTLGSGKGICTCGSGH